MAKICAVKVTDLLNESPRLGPCQSYFDITYDVAATAASNQLLISASTCEGIGHPFSTNCFPLFESLKGTNAANIAVTFIASVRLLVTCFNRRASLRLESGLKSRLMNLSTSYLRRSGCLYVYTGPTLLPEAAVPPEAYLGTWGPAQLKLYERTDLRVATKCDLYGTISKGWNTGGTAKRVQQICMAPSVQSCLTASFQERGPKVPLVHLLRRPRH
jgi:hypothetical protein